MAERLPITQLATAAWAIRAGVALVLLYSSRSFTLTKFTEIASPSMHYAKFLETALPSKEKNGITFTVSKEDAMNQACVNQHPVIRSVRSDNTVLYWSVKQEGVCLP